MKRQKSTFAKNISNRNKCTIDKKYLKLKTFAIIQVNTEVLHVAYVI